MRLNPTDFDIEVGLSIVEISEECEMIIDDGKVNSSCFNILLL